MKSWTFIKNVNTKMRRVISFREQYYENLKKIEMKIIYIILNVHNFSQINLSKLRDASQN